MTTNVNDLPIISTISNYYTLCNQRKLFVSYESGAKTRFELVSPYPDHTQEQLDMRRKAEVLKYKKNAEILTRTKKWTSLVNNNRRRICVERLNIWTPTSSSDVPGPIILLTDDETIPLYNYAHMLQKMVETFPEDRTFPYDTFSKNDIYVNSNDLVNIADQVILSPNTFNYNFTITIPLAITMSGYKTALNMLNGGINIDVIRAEITQLNFQVNYSDVVMEIHPIENTLFTYMEVLLETTDFFEARQYIGNVQFTNVILPTINQYVYSYLLSASVQLTAFVGGNPVANFNSDGMEFSVVSNLVDSNDPYYHFANYCQITHPSNGPVIPFQITGTPLV